MKRPAAGSALLRWLALAWLLAAAGAQGAEIRVLASGGFRAAYLALVPEFERATGHKVVSTWGGSMGAAPTTIPNRLARGEVADVVILAGSSLDELIAKGLALAGSRTDLARSLVGMSVRAGAAKPDIGTVAAFRATLLDARSIAYSSSASGVYLEQLFRKLGLWDTIGPRVQRVQGEPVAAVVARGEAEIGFQQVSELLPVPGADFVGTIPAEVQEVTVFSAGIGAKGKAPDAGRELVRFLSGKAAAPAIRKSGMEPVIPSGDPPPDIGQMARRGA